MNSTIIYQNVRRMVERLPIPRIDQLRLVILMLISIVLAGGGIFLPSNALATQQQICGNGGSGYCINAWNGGPNVNMYYGSSSNEDFRLVSVPNDCNHGRVSDGGTYGYCPFADHELDQGLVNDKIVQVQYQKEGVGPICVGGASGTGYLLPCGNSNGTGAGTGTIMVEYGSVDCSNSNNEEFLVDRYWSDYYGTYSWMVSGGAIGRPDYIDNTSTSECWGGVAI